MRVATIPIRDPHWCEFTSSHPKASPFHLPAWASVISDCYRFDTFVLAVRDTDGEILAGVPTVAVRSPLGMSRWISLPFTDSCPPLVRPDVAVEDVTATLREHVLASRVQELEVRAALPATDHVYPFGVGYIHQLEVPRDVADLHPNKSHRNVRNRAMRMGIEVTRGNAAEDVAAFYRLQTLTRRRLGVPVQPRRFFDLILERILARGNGFIASAVLDGDILAAGLYLAHNGTLVAKYGASDPARPNTGAGYLIDWEMMVIACNEGYHTLDMGRSDPGAEGLRFYKSSWGVAERPLIYTHMARRPPGSHGERSWALPRVVIRNSPLWVCRGLGEVLYRWTA